MGFRLSQCNRCTLSKTRTQVVKPRGSKQASVMFVGEAPGRDEDKYGMPFIGSAGKWLDKIIDAMGLSKGDYYITNVVKCRPVKFDGKNGKPTRGQISRCSSILNREIEKIKPKIIIALGSFAKDRLLEGGDGPIGNFVGNLYNVKYGKVFVMYHPATLLYNKKEMLPRFKRHIREFKRIYRCLD